MLSKSRFFIYIGIILFILQHLLMSFYENNTIINALFIFSFIWLLKISGYKFPKESIVIEKIIIFTFIYLFFCFILRMGYMGIGGILTLAVFLTQYLLIYNIILDEKDYAKIKLIMIVFLLVYSISNHNIWNTNTIGYIYVSLGIYITLFVKNNRKQFPFLLFIIIIIFFLVSTSDSRTSLVAFACYLFLRYIPNKIWQNKILFSALILILTIGSLFYTILYIQLFENSVDLSYIADLDTTGKKIFSGRQFIWMEIHNLLSENPLTGIGSKVSLETSINIHNSILNIFAIYGYIIGILGIIVIYKVTISLHCYTDNYIIKNCLSGYIAFLIIGFSETNLFQESFSTIFPLAIAFSEKNKFYSLLISRDSFKMNFKNITN